jgi:aspartokinase/homoserine dehydrogenase 1
MKNHQGLSGKMFSTLGKKQCQYQSIAQGASERNISAVINQRDVKKHSRFTNVSLKTILNN